MNPLPKSALRVQIALQEKGFSYQVQILPATARTAQDAASAIGCDVAQIMKSLLFCTTSLQPILQVARQGAAHGQGTRGRPGKEASQELQRLSQQPTGLVRLSPLERVPEAQQQVFELWRSARTDFRSRDGGQDFLLHQAGEVL